LVRGRPWPSTGWALRPCGRGSCDVACVHRKAGRNRTAYFRQPGGDRFGQTRERCLQAHARRLVRGEHGDGDAVVGQHAAAGAGRLDAPLDILDDRFPHLERCGLPVERRIEPLLHALYGCAQGAVDAGEEVVH
jgi:hypothetical protein